MSRPTLKREDDRDEPNKWEKGFMLVSTAFTLLVFGFLLMQALTAPPGGPPEARVVDESPTERGDVLVVIELENKGAAGLLVAEVEVKCGEKPHPSVLFENVPAGGREKASILCPPGTSAPEVSVSHFREA